MDGSDEAVLDAMAEHVDLVRQEWAAMGANTRGWFAAVDAPFGQETAGLRRERGPGGVWDDSPVWYAAASVSTLLAVGDQHLATVALLLRHRQVAVSLALPARALLEISGHTAWLLDPRCGPRTRAARAHLAEIDDLTHGRTAAAAFQADGTESLALRVKALRGPLLTARFRPDEIVRLEGGDLVIAGERMPGLSARLDYINQVHEGADWASGGMYSILSNATHPTPHVYRHLTVARGTLQPFELEDATYPYRLARASLMFFIKGWALFAAYMGHNQEVPGDLGEAINGLPVPDPSGHS